VEVELVHLFHQVVIQYLGVLHHQVVVKEEIQDLLVQQEVQAEQVVERTLVNQELQVIHHQ